MLQKPPDLATDRLRFRITCIVGVLLAAVLGITGWHISSDREATLAAARVQAEGYVRALQEHAGSALSEADRALREVVNDIDEHGSPARWDRLALYHLLRRQGEDTPQIRSMFIADRRGMMIVNSLDFSSKPIDVSDREYYRYDREHPDAGIFISRPLVSRLVNRWRFVMTRPLTDRAGRFDGLVAVGFDIDYFDRFYRSLQLGPQGRIYLLRPDGSPVVVEPFSEKEIGVPLDVIRQAASASPSGNLYDAGSDDPRIVAYRQLPRIPLIAVVSLSRDDVLRHWKRKACYEATMTAGLCLAILLITALLFRHLKRLDRTHASLQEQEEMVRVKAAQVDAANDERTRSEHREKSRLLILEEMATGESLQEILSSIVHFVEQESRQARCVVLMADLPGERMQVASAPSLPGLSGSPLDGVAIADGAGPCGTAAGWRTRYVVGEVEVHPFWQLVPAVAEEGLGSCRMEPLVSSQGELLGSFIMFHRRPEVPGESGTRLIESAAHLAGIVIERFRSDCDRKNLEEQLQHSQRIEAIGQLAGGIAHDFNNLLTPILCYADMILLTTPATDPLADKVGAIMRSATKARDLTQQLLSFGRKQTLIIRPVDLNDIVGGFHDILRRTIRENIDINVRLAPGGIGIRADQGQIEQILLNLAVNAQDAIAGNGVITIETGHIVMDNEYVRLHPGLQPGPYALLSFGDTGCGMDDGTLAHIFEPFFTTKQVGHGTGLGLATVYGIIKQHEGSVTVRSSEGAGTTFCIYLPLGEMPAGRQDGEVRVPAGVAGAAGQTVLVAEDNEMVRTMIVEVLEMGGYRVLAAPSPSMALELVRREEDGIALLVSDVVMPEMSGQELYEELLDLQPGLNVLYISGYTNELFAHNGLLEEEITFLQKPFTTERLLDRVRRLAADR